MNTPTETLAEIRKHLSPFVVERDPETMTEVELAEHAAAAIRDGMERIFSADSAGTIKAGDCCGKCAPDLEIVPLASLVEAVAAFLAPCQAVTIHSNDVVTINAFGREFVGTQHEANSLLDASATLLRAEVEA